MPSSVFDNTPAFSNAITSPCTALTSRSTRRAASRMDMAPAPVIVFRHSPRLPDTTLNSNSGDSKLMRGAEDLAVPRNSPSARFPPFHAVAKSPSVSANGRISIVIVFIAPPPYILEKIRHQPINRDKAVFHFPAAHVLVVTLARFVVITQHAYTRDHECQPILVAMITFGKRLWQFPKRQFSKCLLRNRHTTVEQFAGFHVGDNNNSLQVLSNYPTANNPSTHSG